ncbi:MAG: hypothetical protein Sapg2KO_43090 [Saprospiraceae bacterium]
MLGTSEVLARLITDVKEKYDFDQIVDLGSGSGGPMPEAIQFINQNKGHQSIKLLLSDFHPNPAVVQSFNRQNSSSIRYHESPLDARNLNTTPDGLKTMVASFHHMRPAVAKEILQSAEQSKQPILIYELAHNNIPLLVWILLLPLSLSILILMCLFMTPFVRPLKFSQLLFTYLIPVIPLIYAWDGQASLMRTYTFSDIKNLIGNEDSSDYVWEMDDATKENGKKSGYYVLGYPKV